MTSPTSDPRPGRLDPLFVGLLAAPFVVVALLVLLVMPLLAPVVLLIGAVVVWRVLAAGPGRVASLLPGVEADPTTHARALNLLASLAPAIGVASPRLLVAPGPAADLLVAGTPAACTVVITEPALAALDRLQLEAVLAQQLVQVKDGTTGAREQAFATWGLLAGFLPFAASRVAAAAASGDPAGADVAALAVTRFPPALLSGLQALVAAGTSTPPGPAELRPMWLVAGADADATALRLAILEELV